MIPPNSTSILLKSPLVKRTTPYPNPITASHVHRYFPARSHPPFSIPIPTPTINHQHPPPSNRSSPKRPNTLITIHAAYIPCRYTRLHHAVPRWNLTLNPNPYLTLALPCHAFSPSSLFQRPTFQPKKTALRSRMSVFPLCLDWHMRRAYASGCCMMRCDVIRRERGGVMDGDGGD